MNKTETKLRKGCGKKFIWIDYLKDERICGEFEDLKHSEHIILCPNCKAKIQQYLADKKEFLEMINNGYYVIEELKQQLSDEETEVKN